MKCPEEPLLHRRKLVRGLYLGILSQRRKGRGEKEAKKHLVRGARNSKTR